MMKLRKMVALLLSLILVVGVFSMAGCGKEDEDSRLKVGVIYISPKTDGGWSEAHAKGFQKAVEKVGADKVQLIEIESIDDNDAQKTETAIRQLAEQGCELIFATSYNYMNTVAKLAEEFDEINFEHCSGYISSENMANYFGQIEQARFLSGMVAGRMTESNQLGFVAAQKIPEVMRAVNSFTLGARYVNPDVEVKVSWTNTWYDPQKEKEAAIALIDSGCDVVGQHQDSTATQEAAQEKGIYGIGYDNPMYSEAIKDAYLTAPIWLWDAYYAERIEAMLNDSWETGSYWGGMAEGIVALDEMTDLVPQDVQDEVNGLVDTMKSEGNAFVFAGPINDNTGELRVPEGESMDKDAQMSMDWYVEGITVAAE